MTYTSSSTQPAASSAISGTTAGRGNSVSSTSGFADGRGRARELAATASDAVAGAEASGAAHAAAAMGTSLAFCASSNASLANLRTAIAQQEADSLWERRRYWYKPVAMLAGQPYSISEGEALHFCLGKRMIAGNDGATSRARAKSDSSCTTAQAVRCRPRWSGRAAASPRRPRLSCESPPRGLRAPADAKWPTVGGVWAFEVIVPVSIALEQQTWMEDVRWPRCGCPPHLRACVSSVPSASARAYRCAITCRWDSRPEWSRAERRAARVAVPAARGGGGRLDGSHRAFRARAAEPSATRQMARDGQQTNRTILNGPFSREKLQALILGASFSYTCTTVVPVV